MFLPAWAGLALLWTPTFPQHTYVESHPWFNILAGSPVEIRIFVMNCISPILGLFWEPLRPPMLAVCTNMNLDPVLLLDCCISQKSGSFHEFGTFKQVYILQNSMFLLIWVGLEPPFEPKFLSTALYGVIPLVLWFDRRTSFKMDLNDDLQYVFFHLFP